MRAVTSTLIVSIFSLAASQVAMAQSTAVEIDSIRVRATVSAINHSEALLTLELPNGREGVYRVVETVPPFDHIKVGDKLRVTLLESLAVSLDEGASVIGPNSSDTVTLAAQGKRVNLISAHTERVRCRITATSLRDHRVTLQFDGGEKRAVNVNRQVDLARIKLGQTVVARLTRALVVDIAHR